MITSHFGQSLFNTFNKNSINPSEVIATVDSIQITAGEFFYNYEYGPSFTKRSSNSKYDHLNFMINEKLLALQGFNKDILKNEEYLNLLHDIQSDVATEELYRDSILGKVNISQTEIDKMVREKNTDIYLRWLFEKNEDSILKQYENLLNGVSFDSLFKEQINDSVFVDQRSLNTDLYSLRKKNSELAKICDKLHVTAFSAPFNIRDEWYIIEKTNMTLNLIMSESDLNKNKKESLEALTQQKSDSISDLFVKDLLNKHNPNIQRNAFNVARSYIGKYRLKKELYDKWELEKELELALEKYGLTKSSNQTSFVLVELSNDNIFLEDFIKWFRNRNLYIKLPTENLTQFSKSLQDLIWLMIRDNLLAEKAVANNYYENYWVKQQNRWWKEKVAYAAYRKELEQSLIIEDKELNRSSKETIEYELTKKIFREINTLRKKYEVSIHNELLDKINVSIENDRHAINFYAAKNKGIIPRPPYPSIDNDWVNWKF